MIVKCPNCRDNLVKSTDTEVKMRVALVKWNKDGVFAVCKACKTDVEISPDVLKSINTKFTFETKKG